jgi:hypothetical protein
LSQDWQDLQGIEEIYTEYEYIHNTDVSSGIEYTLRIRAKNKHGWGEFSPEVTILAATEPAVSASTTSE